jgi:imidazolonepropionase-like amidohydrolase
MGPEMTVVSTFVSAGWLIDGTGSASRKDVVIKVSGEIIVSIIDANSPEIDRNNVIDYSGCTIIPGLVDSHVHLAMSGETDQGIRKKQLNASFDDQKDSISRNLNKHLQSGIVAVRDGGDRQGHVLRYRQQDFSRYCPVIIRSPGKAWHASGHYGGFMGRSPVPDRTLAESILEDHEDIDHVKIINSGINSLVSYGKETLSQFDFQELKNAVSAAGSLGLKTMIHANGKEAVRFAIESGCHSIEHGYFMGDDNLKRMFEAEVTWVPTLFAMETYSRFFPKGNLKADVAERNFENQIEQVSRAAGYGVTIAAGTDSGSFGVNHGVSLKNEIRLLVSAGLGLEEAVKCASFNGAKLMGVESANGALKPGMRATFVAVRGQPQGFLDSFESPEAVWVSGKPYGSCHPIS